MNGDYNLDSKSYNISNKIYDKIAIFGGSFSPLHIGHIEMAKIILQKLDIDKLIILPAFQNPLKDSKMLRAEMRLQWAKDVFLDSKIMESKFIESKVMVSAYEISQNRAVSSIESILYFKNLFHSKRIFFIIGGDNLFTLPQWSDFKNLIKVTEFIVFKRKNSCISDSGTANIAKEDSIKYYDFANKYNIKIQLLDFDIDISSSQIRENLESNKDFIPQKIRDSIIFELKNTKGEI